MIKGQKCLCGSKVSGGGMSSGGFPRVIEDLLSRFHFRERNPGDYHQNDPKIGKILCADSRMRDDDLFGAGVGDAFLLKSLGAVVLPFGGESSLDAWFALNRMKGVRDFLIVGHGDCGASKATVVRPVPQADRKDWDEISHISNFISKSGLELPRLVGEFRKVAGKNDETVADLMSRAMLLQSLKNIMTHPGIEEGIRSKDPDKQVSVLAAYVRMGPNESRVALEYYDINQHRFVEVREDASIPRFSAGYAQASAALERFIHNPLEALGHNAGRLCAVAAHGPAAAPAGQFESGQATTVPQAA